MLFCTHSACQMAQSAGLSEAPALASNDLYKHVCTAHLPLSVITFQVQVVPASSGHLQNDLNRQLVQQRQAGHECSSLIVWLH